MERNRNMTHRKTTHWGIGAGLATALLITASCASKGSISSPAFDAT